MAQKFALVFWTTSKRTSIVPEESFEKSILKDGEKIPLFEGAIRMVSVGGKRFEAKILRICSSRKYLDSLLVTKEGEILLHGAKAPSRHLLAKRSKLLFNDETKQQIVVKNILRVLNANAEEQPPSTRLDGRPECNHGCSQCCSKTMPSFPTLPEGFVNTLVSLADYFQHFHKSTAENILAAGLAISSMSQNHSEWQWPSTDKVELKKGAGVWIHASELSRILEVAKAAKKPYNAQNLALVKGLLTHLLGMQKYMETSAEKMDRRLLSAVCGFTNDKYPDQAQSVERYYRSINLNRGYLLKRKNEIGNKEMEYDPLVKRLRTTFGSSRDTQSSAGRALNSSSSADQVVIRIDSEDDEDVPTVSNKISTAASSNPTIANTTNKIILVRRSVPSAENLPNVSVHSNAGNSMTTSVHSNIQQNLAPVPNSFRPVVNVRNGLMNSTPVGSLQTSNVLSNMLVSAGNIVSSRSVLNAGNIASNRPVFSAAHIVSNRPVLNAGNIASNRSVLGAGHIVSNRPVLSAGHIVSNRPVLTAGHIVSNRPVSSAGHTVSNIPVLSAGHVISNRPVLSAGHIVSSRPVQNAGYIVSNRPVLSTGNVITHALLANPQQTGNYVLGANNLSTITGNLLMGSVRPNHAQVSTSVVSGFSSSQNSLLSSPQLNSSSLPNIRRSVPNSGGIQISQLSTFPQKTVTTLSELGSFRFASSLTPKVGTSNVKVEEDLSHIEGALNITL